jgi:hypothetical protein
MLRVILGAVALCCLLDAPAAAADPPTPESYIAGQHFPSGVDGAKLLDALKDAGQNWPELARALDAVPARYPDPQESAVALGDLAWLLVNAPHLDRLELTGNILHNNLALALNAADKYGYDPSSDFFRRYVLNYRIDDEPVTDWRQALHGDLGPTYQPGGGLELLLLKRQAADALRGFQVRERGFFGPEADPVSLARARAGTKTEEALLLAADLRASGYATRFVSDDASGTSWVEVYSGDPHTYDAAAWTPVYPQAPDKSGDPSAAAALCGGGLSVVTAGDAFGHEQVTARYSATGAVDLVFTRGGIAQKGFEGYAITCWHDGTYVPLDDLEYPVSAMDYPLDQGTPAAQDAAAQRFHLAAPGSYRLEAGVRYPGGITDVKLQEFGLQPGDDKTLTLALDPPADLPQAALIERDLPPPPAGTGLQTSGRYVIAVLDASEPSVRTKALLKPYAAMDSVQYIELGYAPDDTNLKPMLDYLQVKPDDAKPVVVVIVDGKTLLYRRGYDLSIGDWVQRALGGGK